MRALIFLLVSSSAHFFAAKWVLSVFPVARRRRLAVIAVACMLAVSLASLRLLSVVSGSPLLRRAVAFAMIELAAVVFSLIPIGIGVLVARASARALRAIKSEAAAPAAEDDAKERIIGRREAIERVAGVSIFGATSMALGWGSVCGRHAFTVEEVVVKIPGWPKSLEGYVIAQVSDIHVGPFVGDRELDEGFELVRRVRPDLVVATGDLVDYEAAVAPALAARLLSVPARDGAYAILGNHDHYAGAGAVVERLRAAGARVLVNEGVRIRSGDGGGFALLGLDDLKGGDRSSPGFEGPNLDRATRSVPRDVPRILLAHQPVYFRQAAGEVALQLSGHTHGGQINPGWRPADMVMEFVAGRYERNGSTLWVNRGFGVAGPPARVGAPPEVTKIVIVSG